MMISYQELVRTFPSIKTITNLSDTNCLEIHGASLAYPEIYFSKLVIFGEGDSEEVIIPKVLELYSTDIDSHSISVVPLGGRHVNHFWRLLKSLQIPYITLLDFDIDRNGGGFGRIKYAIEQLAAFGVSGSQYIHQDISAHIPAWDSKQNPKEFTLTFNSGDTVNITEALEGCNIYFSSPLDIDYAMIESFPEIFCVVDESNGEQGPEEIEQGKEIDLIKAVLKGGSSGVRYPFSTDYLNYFLWYRYRFLSNKSKPASHIRMFAKLEQQYTPAQIIERLPSELIKVAEKTVKLLSEIVE
ncbi:ATP-dependent endonuclease [Klebsiella michiganensis]|uniref:ATP-dependent endonuclease n=1 Tax=Klebsiella michiganensis TaxID=1134687 RepID=UPI002FEF1C49